MSTQLHDFKNQAILGAAPYPVAATTTDSGSAVDLGEGDGRCFAIQQIGAISGSGAILTGKIQESADNSTFTDISGATFTAVTTASNLQVISFERTRRYVRHHRTVAGSTPSLVLGVLIGQQRKSV